MVPSSTSDSRLWLQRLGTTLEVIYQSRYEYKKAEFALLEFCRDQAYRGDLLMTKRLLPEYTVMIAVLDAINRKYGTNTMRP